MIYFEWGKDNLKIFLCWKVFNQAESNYHKNTTDKRYLKKMFMSGMKKKTKFKSFITKFY